MQSRGGGHENERKMIQRRRDVRVMGLKVKIAISHPKYVLVWYCLLMNLILNRIDVTLVRGK